MKKTFNFLMSIMILFSFISCVDDKEGDKTANVEEVFSLDGVVKQIDVEGGCWQIVGDDGNNYEPINLSKEYAIDGLPVEVDMKQRNDLCSTCQVGIITEIVNINQRSQND